MDIYHGQRRQPAVPWRAERPPKRLTELRGMPVVDLSSASRIGSVTNIFVDPNAGRVQAIEVGRAGDISERRINAVDIRRIGNDAVVMLAGTGNGVVVESLKESLAVSTIVGLEVISESGDRVGHIADVCLNRETLEVEAYELETPAWERMFRGAARIEPDRVMLCSADVMIIGHPQSVTVTVSPPVQVPSTRREPASMTGSGALEETQVLRRSA
jgi:uncharacterized protein YrrD